ncbi:MAG: hypothetical protein J6S31_06170 [Lachnospiraceae bacterium]|nr:hypothetical protein [Lachnospiraceae bacterium]
MKKKIKILNSIVILILILALLSGCGIFQSGKTSCLGSAKEKESKPEMTTQEMTTEEVTTKEAATEPTTSSGGIVSGDGGEVALDANTQYEANIFLSNFVEQYDFVDFSIYTYGGPPVINFAHRFAKINDSGAISYDSLYEVISLDYVQGILDRFFGLTISAPDYLDLPAPTYTFDSSFHGPYYKDGKFYYDAADGATYTRFAVVYKILNFADGHQEMAFRIYDRLDFDTVGGLAVSDAHYHLTLAEAEANPNLLNVGNGYAYVYPKYYNGHNTYQLIEYHEYGLGGIESY